MDNASAMGYLPEVPYSATGTLQYIEPFEIIVNGTAQKVYLWCTSVIGEPTRGYPTDGQYGRANEPIKIPTPRRQRPGWDGCDGLQYRMPYGRYDHAAVYHELTEELIMYGGEAYDAFHEFSAEITYPSMVAHDMWVMNFRHCINNCSLHGDCIDGFCECYVGYYGVDCSNTSCPGTACYNEEVNHKEHCRHACQSAYEWTENDHYVQDIFKTPCTRYNQGYESGICDGYGHVQCRAPFLTEDCSVKDCKDDCSFNGFCAIEFPVSRCLCHSGYYGETCNKKSCLNNCTYPNGVCNEETGNCNCRMTMSPYNNSRDFRPWAGTDCSYIHPYESGSRPVINTVLCLILTGIITFLHIK